MPRFLHNEALPVVTMFRGHFEHAIDAKGRTSLPARFRDVLVVANDLRLVVTKALGEPRCLDVYPLRAWEELEHRASRLSQFDPAVVRWRRLYLSAAVECDVDRQGRILVPASLREHAGLDREVVWAGMGPTAELWAKERWEGAQVVTEAEMRELRAILTEQLRP